MAKKYGWLDECIQHMIRINKPHNFWQNKENVINSIKSYKNVTTWRKKYSGAYHSAMKNKWIGEISQYFKNKI